MPSTDPVKIEVSLSSPFPIWQGTPPLARGASVDDIPTLTPYPSPQAEAQAPALLILPGGGYGGLADHEGTGYAEWFARYGIRTFVLRYRLGSRGYRHPAMLTDAARAMRVLRAEAAQLKIHPGRIGVIGSSAGGHLAATLLTKFDDGDAQAADLVERQSSRPDVGLLCYPVVTFEEPFAHAGSRENLLGEKHANAELRTLLSAEKQVTAQTPPCFIWHTAEDGAVTVENSLLFASALRAAGVPFALHVYEQGGHGLGLRQHGWAAEAIDWLSLRWPLPRNRG